MLRPSPDARQPLLSFLPQLRLNRIVVGTICCIVAALGYTGVDICVRVLTFRCDRVLLLLVKESVAVVLAGAWLAHQWRRRTLAPIGWRHALALMAVGTLTQLAANLPFIWAMAIVGLAVSVTVTLGTNLIASAVLSRVFLREQVSRRSAVAIGLLTGSVMLLTFGAERVAESMPPAAAVSHGTLWVLLAVAAVCGAGIVYGLLSVAIRRASTDRVPLGFTAFIVPAMAVVWLGPVGLWRVGLSGVSAVAVSDLLLMLLCGLLNLVAYVAIIKGLELTSVVHANVLSASQVAMGSVAGILLFSEAPSAALVVGVAMTIAGMVLIDHRNGA